MDVEKSYASISWFFNAWTRLVEYDTRKMEVLESANLGPGRLIISPPTDAGIPLLTRANTRGETGLLCFSDGIARIAARYCRKRRIDTLATLVQPFFQIPVPDESLSVVYANCLFDFCAMEDFDSILREIWRVLEPAGVLFAVYMAPSRRRGGRLRAWLFEHPGFLSNGCHPVTIEAHLARNGFKILKDIPAARHGFPAQYSVSVKPEPVTVSVSGDSP